MNTPNAPKDTPEPRSLRESIDLRVAEIMPHVEDPKYVHENYDAATGLMITLHNFLRTEKAISEEDRQRYRAIHDKLEQRLDEEDKAYWGSVPAIAEEPENPEAIETAQRLSHRTAKRVIPELVLDLSPLFPHPPKPDKSDPDQH